MSSQRGGGVHLARWATATIVALLAAPGAAHGLTPPEVFLRPVEGSDPLGEFVPASGAVVRSQRDQQIGVRLQASGEPANRQRFVVRVIAVPDGTPDQPQVQGTSACAFKAGAPGEIVSLNDAVQYEGDGAYRIAVTISTGQDLRVGCEGGPATEVAWTADTSVTTRFTGRLLTKPSHVTATGGLEVTGPAGGAVEAQCARDPVRRPDGGLGGSALDRATGLAQDGATVRLAARDLFGGGGRWACVARSAWPERPPGPWSAPTPVRDVQEGFSGLRGGSLRLLDPLGPTVRVSGALASPLTVGGSLAVELRRNPRRAGPRTRVRIGPRGRFTATLRIPGLGYQYLMASFGGTRFVAAAPPGIFAPMAAGPTSRGVEIGFAPPCPGRPLAC